MEFVDLILNLDQHLTAWVAALGIWSYALLFLVIFCETGLIVMPFLPGDSLLFAVGALAALDASPLDVVLVLVLLTAAAILGDGVNYSIGRRAGSQLLTLHNGKLINKTHLARTESFYQRHGGKTIVFARFIPIIRTFAPFVAGMARMERVRFTGFNVCGAVLWVFSLVLAGYLFGNVPLIKDNFHVVILAIVGISLLPVMVEGVRVLAARWAQSA